MDQERFDRLAVTLARGANRRTLLQVLSGTLMGGGSLAAAEVAGKGKGKGKHQRHGKRKASTANAAKRRKRQPDKRDRAQAQACPLCKRLSAQGRCVVDHRVNGQCCTRAGVQSGQCLNGQCLPGQCSGPICTDQTCPDGCCDAAALCHVDDADACGTGGGTSAPCDVAGEVSQEGDCVCESGVICSVSGCCPNATDVCDGDDQCCAPKTCADYPGQCGTLDDGCGEPIACDCPTCQTCGSGGTCEPVASGTPCGNPSDNVVCLDNGACGIITCPPTCPAGCGCSGPTVPNRCYENIAAACPTAQACAPTAPQCPPGFHCLACPDGSLRCIPLCTG